SNKVAVARGGSIQVYGIESNRLDLLKEFLAHRDAVEALAFSANGEWLASGAFSKTVLWETGLEITNRFVTALAFAPTGSVLAIADRGDIQLFDVAARK